MEFTRHEGRCLIKQKIKQVGLIGDELGTVKFTSWVSAKKLPLPHHKKFDKHNSI